MCYIFRRWGFPRIFSIIFSNCFIKYWFLESLINYQVINSTLWFFIAEIFLLPVYFVGPTLFMRKMYGQYWSRRGDLVGLWFPRNSTWKSVKNIIKRTCDKQKTALVCFLSGNIVLVVFLAQEMHSTCGLVHFLGQENHSYNISTQKTNSCGFLFISPPSSKPKGLLTA